MSSWVDRLPVLREAAKDLRYLLNRGYNKPSALKLVGDRYQLNRSERVVLLRSVYSKKDVREIAGKRVGLNDVKGEEIWIDGFNLLNTIEAALREEPLLLCDDGIIRDFSEIYGKYRVSDNTWRALKLIAGTLSELKVSKTRMLFESQISRSGEIAAEARRILEQAGVDGTAETSRSVDSELSKTEKIVATSDSAILLRCRKFFDLSAYIIPNKIKGVSILSLSNLNVE